MAAASAGTRRARPSAALRDGDQVAPLELFFVLVFVLAITQCTALMYHRPTCPSRHRGAGPGGAGTPRD